MNDAAIRQSIAEALAGIAPEAELGQVDPHRSLRDQLDLDSFDFLNLLIALNERLGVEVPESDYAKVDSLDTLAAYLAARMNEPR